MSPRVQLGSVPFATQALTVPDGSITKAKLAGDVSLIPPDGSITTAKIANDANEPSRIQTWSSGSDYIIDNAGSNSTIVVESTISVTVPTGKAYFYIVEYQGEFSYRFTERINSIPGLYGQWNASLLANLTEVGPPTKMIQTGYRQDWANVGGSSYWFQPYHTTWLVRLTEGTHLFKIQFQGYSDSSMSKGHLTNQSLHVIRVY